MKSCFANSDFIKDKESLTITTSFKHYIAWLSRQKNANVKWVRTDNGGEYMGKEFQDICAKSGIIHETTSPHTPEHNGIAERYNRTFQEGALTLRHDAVFQADFGYSPFIRSISSRIVYYTLA